MSTQGLSKELLNHPGLTPELKGEFMSYLSDMQERKVDLDLETIVLEKCLELVTERGESRPGEINQILTGLDLCTARAWFAGFAVAGLEGGGEAVKAYLGKDKSKPRKKNTDSRNGITDFDIERARAYPVRDLLDDVRGRRARCINPDHDDKHPSMAVYESSVHCFACDYNADSIGVYMLLYQCDFVTAVKNLS